MITKHIALQCCQCGHVRTELSWKPIDKLSPEFMEEHKDSVSHGYCPPCAVSCRKASDLPIDKRLHGLLFDYYQELFQEARELNDIDLLGIYLEKMLEINLEVRG